MRTALLLVFVLSWSACDSETAGGGEEISRLVTITNQWSNASDAQHYFDLVAGDFDQEGTARGTFKGCESRPTPGGQNTFHGCPEGLNENGRDEYEVEGEWQQNTVTLRTERPGGPRTYRAPVPSDNPTTLRFVDQGDSSVLVLTRGN